MKINEPKAQFIMCNSPSFIYFLTMDDEVVYIGGTTNGSISNTSNKEFNGIYFIFCNVECIDYEKNQYIIKYLPKYNKSLSLKGSTSITNVAKLLRKTYNTRKIHDSTVIQMCKELLITPYEYNRTLYIADFEVDFIIWAIEDYDRGIPVSEVFNIRL